MGTNATGRTRNARSVTVTDSSEPTRPAGKVFRCQVNLSQREGVFVAVAAALPGVAGVGATETESLADIVRAFKVVLPRYLSAAGKIPWLAEPVEPEPGGVTRWVFPEIAPE
jgi:hypothetical protein